MRLKAISLRVAITVLMPAISATVGLANSITPAAGLQNWYTPYGGPGAVSSLGPIGPDYWTQGVGDVTVTPVTGYTDVSVSTTPSVEADAGVGVGIDNPSTPTQRTTYLGSIAGATEDFYFEVDYIGSGSALTSVPVIGYFDFAGTASCSGQFNAFGVGTGPNAGGTGFVVNQGGCDGQFSDTWMEPDGEQVHGQIEVGSDSNGETSGETALASVQLAIDPNICDALWQQAGAPSCTSQLGSVFTADSGLDTNPADYEISYSDNLVTGAPEPGTIGLGLLGFSLLLLRFRRLRNSRPCGSAR